MDNMAIALVGNTANATAVSVAAAHPAYSANLTYVASAHLAEAALAAANTFRVTIAGHQTPSAANGQTTYGAHLFNIHAGTTNSVSDLVLLSVVESPSTIGQFYKEFILQVKSIASSNANVVVAMSAAGSANTLVSPSQNVHISNDVFLGISYQAVPSTSNPSEVLTNLITASIDLAVIEQIA
jgi:hypothetical protein